MKIEIRNIERTSLEPEAYLKLVRKFKKLKHKLLIVFDQRLKCFGQHVYDSDKKLHVVRISPKMHKNIDKQIEKYGVLSTTLHELRHAQQKEEKGMEFWSKKYRAAADIKNPAAADWWSICETDARAYENQNICKAVETYNKYTLQIKK